MRFSRPTGCRFNEQRKACRRAEALAGRKRDRKRETQLRQDKRSRPGRSRAYYEKKRRQMRRPAAAAARAQPVSASAASMAVAQPAPEPQMRRPRRPAAAAVGAQPVCASAASMAAAQPAPDQAAQTVAPRTRSQKQADEANYRALKAAAHARRRRGLKPQPGDDLVSSDS